MKATGSILLCLLATGILLADDPAAVATSERLKGIIRAGLPTYTPPPAAPKDLPTDVTPADPGVLVLPKVIVQEKRIPTNDPDAWRSESAIQQKAMKAYKDSMTPLEWVLNCWFVPPFSAPASVRARAAYEENKLAEQVSLMTHLADVGKLDDAPGAAGLKKAVIGMVHADDWQNRPAGDR